MARIGVRFPVPAPIIVGVTVLIEIAGHKEARCPHCGRHDCITVDLEKDIALCQSCRLRDKIDNFDAGLAESSIRDILDTYR